MKWTSYGRGFLAETKPETEHWGYKEWPSRLHALADDDGDDAVTALIESADAAGVPWYARKLTAHDAGKVGKRLATTQALRAVQFLSLRNDKKLNAAALSNPQLGQVKGLELWESVKGKKATEAVQRMLDSSMGPLELLRLADGRYSTKDVETLLDDPRVANARTLGLAGTKLGSGGYAMLAELPLPNLQVLDLSFTADRLTKKVVASFAAAPWMGNLRSLAVGLRDYTTKEGAWQPFFAGADTSQLRELSISTTLFDPDLEQLAGRPLDQLVSLELTRRGPSQPPTDDALVRFFREAELPSLRRLHTFGVPLSEPLARALLDAPWYDQLLSLNFDHGEGRALLESDGRLPLMAPKDPPKFVVAEPRWKKSSERY